MRGARGEGARTKGGSMKVVYLGRASRRVNAPPKVEGDVLELLSNNWDDFGFKTSFMTVCSIDKKEVDLGLIRLLVDEVHIDSDYLDKLLQQGWAEIGRESRRERGWKYV